MSVPCEQLYKRRTVTRNTHVADFLAVFRIKRHIALLPVSAALVEWLTHGERRGVKVEADRFRGVRLVFNAMQANRICKFKTPSDKYALINPKSSEVTRTTRNQVVARHSFFDEGVAFCWFINLSMEDNQKLKQRKVPQWQPPGAALTSDNTSRTNQAHSDRS